MPAPATLCLTVLTLTWCAGAAVAQRAADTVVARFLVDGKPATVSADDLAAELGHRFRATEEGKTGISFLVDLQLVRAAATEASIVPTRSDTRAWIDALQGRLRRAGMSLNALMKKKNMTRQEFEDYASLQLAQERLVRRALDLDDDQPVSPQALNLWVEEARRKRGVEMDPARLPPGVVAKIGTRTISEIELGHMLRRTMQPSLQRRYVYQIVLKRCISADAAEHSIEVSAAEMTAEVAARRREAESNPVYRGITFESLLESQGTSVEDLAHSPVLRAQIQERKLVEKLLPDAEIKRQIASDRAAVLQQHGARRRVLVLLVRAPGEGGDQGARDAAATKIDEIRQEIREGTAFADAARKFSEDPYTKVSGGDAGWINRSGSKLPREVSDAAFAADPQQLIGPIQCDEGLYLLQVTAVEAEPNDATLVFRVRQAFAAEHRQQLVAAARIEYLDQGLR